MPAHRPRRRAVEACQRVSVPFAAAVDRLGHSPESLVGSTLPDEAEAPATTLAVDLMGSLVHLQREVRVGFGRAFEDEGAFVLPLWWEAAEHPHLYPTFDGGIELRPCDGDTEVRLAGSYEPPLGSAGRFADGIFGHRLVNGSLETFLTSVAKRLAGTTPPPACPRTR